MICVSLKAENFEELEQKCARCEFAEIRLDDMNLGTAQLQKILSLGTQLIVSCRPGQLDATQRLQLLLRAAQAGASYVDIELEAEAGAIAELKDCCSKHACKLIVSHHNYQATPSELELRRLLEHCFEQGADIAKLACQVNSLNDNAKLLALLADPRAGSIVPIGMGNLGQITRVIAPLLGSPFTYAALAPGQETAPGQLDLESMQMLIDFLRNKFAGATKCD